MGSVPRMTKPYRAAMRGKWTEVKSFYDKHTELLHTPLTAAGDTALHIAVYFGKTDLLEALLRQLKSEFEDLPFEIEGRSPYQVKNEHGHTALHLAAAAGNIPALKLLLDYDVELLNVKNNREETALFRAAAFGRTKVVRNLASRIHDKGPHLRRKDSTSILHIAILGKYFETAVELLKWGVSPNMVDENGMTCFQLLANMPSAFKSGYRMGKLKALLYYCLPDVEYAENFDKEIDPESHVTSSQTVDIESGNEKKYLHPCGQPAERPSVVSRVYNAFWSCLARGFPIIKELWRDKKKHTKLLELTKILAETDFLWKSGHSGGAPDEKISTLKDDEEDVDEEEKKEDYDASDERTPPKAASSGSFLYETPFIAAARNGILEIVQAILDFYPQAIEHVNYKKENIFHVVAKHRRTEILDLLESSYVPITRLRKKINVDGDSILHSAAYLGPSFSRDRPGEALRMQSEIQWFKRVQKIVPQYFINHRNSNKMTAQELFTEEHKELVKGAQEWLMRTTQACTLVAVLIATVAFTCAYTVPGGPSKTGQPLLLKTTAFSIFATSDALSLCFSLTSVVVFLSIMTSKMHEQDFRSSLPSKLVLGLTTLFLAVTFMMVAFAATLMLMIRQRLHWAAIPIYTIACCPVTIFIFLHLPLYLNIAWFTVKDLFSGISA